MIRARTRRTPSTLLALCCLVACAAPSMDNIAETEPAGPPVLEGALGEVVADLMYGAPEVRTRAAGDLKSMGPDAAPATEHLLLALEDELPAVRALSAEALGAIGGDPRQCLPALQERLTHDREEGVQTAAAEAIVAFGPNAVAVLLECMSDSRPAVRWQAVQALGEVDGDAKGTLEPLLRALDDRDAKVRWCTAKTLGRIHADSGQVVQPLIRALSDSEHQVRANAAWSLGSCGAVAKRAVLPLIDALRDTSADVRMSAAHALGELGPHAAQASMDLTSALDDPDPKVVHEVSAALAAIQQS